MPAKIITFATLSLVATLIISACSPTGTSIPTANPLINTAQATQTTISTIPITPIPSQALVLTSAVGGEIGMHAGPGADYPVPQTFHYGTMKDTILVLGRNSEGTWFMVADRFDPSTCAEMNCWVALNDVELDPSIIKGLKIIVYQPTSEPITATIQEPDVKLRTGPGEAYPVFGQVQVGLKISPEQRNADGTWLYFQLPETLASGSSVSAAWVERSMTDLSTDNASVLSVMQSIDPPPAAIPGWSGEPVGSVCLDLHGVIYGKFASDHPDATLFNEANSFTGGSYREIYVLIKGILEQGLGVRLMETNSQCDATLEINLEINMLGANYLNGTIQNSGGTFCYDGVDLRNMLTLTQNGERRSFLSFKYSPNSDMIKGCPLLGSLFGEEGNVTTISNLRKVWGDQVLIAVLKSTAQGTNLYYYAMQEINKLDVGSKSLAPQVLAYCTEAGVSVLSEDCQRALRSVTGQHFGADPHLWEQWLSKQLP